MAEGLDEAREWLETMVLIRRFEERAGQMYAKNKVGGFLHLAVGEEATIVGAVRAMRDEDYLISTYRSHGHALARGTDPKKVMAELFGKQTGVSGGRGGSMHMFDGERRFMGGYGIVGGNLPLAAGIALSSDYRETEEVTVCVFGDGAANQGTFGETLNLAALWHLPVVFMVTNNQFGMGTALERHTAQTDLHKRGEGLGVPGLRCDGMDIGDTYEVMSEAIETVRRERSPLLVEAVTYRFLGHSMADPEEYRTKDQVKEWREKHDPIKNFAAKLDDTDLDALDEAATKAHRRGGRVRRGVRLPVAGVDLRPRLRARRAGQGRPWLSSATARRSTPALREEMQRDERVLIMGEDIGVFNGAFKVTQGLLEEFGEKRVRDTPISENTIVGVGVGAAMTGLRPIVELMTVNFSLLAMDQIVNHMATIHYMFGGQVTVPMVVRFPQGAGHQLGPTHSHCLESLFLHVPGMLVAVPSTPADAKGLLKAAIRDDNPVVFIEHESLYGAKGEVPDDEDLRRRLRQGRDPPRGHRRDDRRHLADGDHRAVRRRGARRRASSCRGDRSAHAAPARPRHDPRERPQDQPRGDRRRGLAARRRRRQPRGADPGAGVRPSRRADRPRDRRRSADAVLQAAGADRLPARAADRRESALALLTANRVPKVL